MSNYIVMQGQTYHEEKEMGIIWSQQQDKGGSTPHSWERMKEVQKDDRIFHYVKGYITAISVAKGAYRTAPRPEQLSTQPGWNEEGFLVETNYHELDVPLSVKEHFPCILPLLPVKYSAFQEDGNGNQGYLYPCNEKLAIQFLELISDLNIYTVDQEQLEFSIDQVKSTERNTLIPVLAEAESEVKTKLRLGQQNFRKGVLPLWNSQCAICGISLPELLQASHSKPWKDGTNEERIDPFNGLLLCRNHAGLYEKGFIAFDGSGRLHISGEIAEEQYPLYDLKQKFKLKLYPENKPYVKWHKKHLFRK